MKGCSESQPPPCKMHAAGRAVKRSAVHAFCANAAGIRNKCSQVESGTPSLVRGCVLQSGEAARSARHRAPGMCVNLWWRGSSAPRQLHMCIETTPFTQHEMLSNAAQGSAGERASVAALDLLPASRCHLPLLLSPPLRPARGCLGPLERSCFAHA